MRFWLPYIKLKFHNIRYITMGPPEVKYTQLFINNKFVNSVSGKTFPTINPSTGEKICDVQEGDKADVDLAVQAARDAFKLGSPWRTMDASERAQYLTKLASLMQRDKEYLAHLETMDNGMVVSGSRSIVDRAVGLLHYYAGWADKISGKTIPIGVVNVIPGYGLTAGAALSEHMDVDVITFTGSVEVGKLVQQASGRSNLKHVCLELGGKSPNVVFADADLDQAVELSHNALFAHSGQICVAGSRTFVQEDIYDEFVKKSTEWAKRRIVGDPYDKKSESGPVIDEDQMSNILGLIESGKSEGAKLQCGGARCQGKGNFIESTVFSDVTDDMRIAKDEIFGPVQQILKFKTIEEVIERSNNTSYGLAAAVITKDLDKALMVANSIRAGVVWVNTFGVLDARAPFGGYKMSGIGREGGEEALLEFSEIKSVVIKVSQKNS